MSEQRLIDLDTARQDLWDWAEDVFSSEPDNSKFNSMLDVIDAQPIIEPPVVHGHWIEPVLMRCEYGCMCSKCENFNDVASNFCPNCGADMRGDNI